MPQIVSNGVDWSAGELTGPQIKEAGYSFAARYLSYDWRGLRQSEVDSFLANDVGLVIIGEYDTIDSNDNQVSAMLGGYTNGLNQSRYADSIRMARGLPDLQPIQFTLDVQPGSIPWTDVSAYLRGAADGLGGVDRVGLYAGFDGIEFAHANGLAKWFWQTYAWSGGRLHPAAQLYQYDIYGEYVAGINVDLNKAFVENYGQTQMFNGSTPIIEVYAVPVHPDWFSASLSIRYPTVGRWEWRGQTIVLHPIRHNALTHRNTNQYAEPLITSAHAGPMIPDKAKVSIERIGDVQETGPRGGKKSRPWVLTSNGTWIPEDTLDLDFTIARRKLKK